MKIGILTFHFACNYGAALQCYALQRYLIQAGHQVAVVDYRPKAVAGGYKWFDLRRFWGSNPVRFWRKTASELKVIGSRRRRYVAFDTFVRENLTLTKSVRDVSSMSELAASFDMIIVGSDQVWNKRITAGIDRLYWGDFVRETHTSLVSYAASMEDGFDNESVTAVKRLLKNFDALSVREDSLRDRLSPYLPDKSIATVADPTLLLDETEWDSLISDPVVEEPYLLLYQVRTSDKAIEAATVLAQRMGLKPVFLSAKPELANSPEVADASPEKFVNLIKNASYVVTTSFHGTVFSVIFKKNFICVSVKDGKNRRQENLLEALGLSDRMVSDVPSSELPDIDWANVGNRRQELLESSFDYLKSCGL